MALKGCFKQYKYEEHPTETVTEIDADGVEAVVPKMVSVVSEQWDDAYVRVVSYQCWRMNATEMSLDINYFVWETEELANSGDWEGGLVYNMVVPVNSITWAESQGNTWETAYEILERDVEYLNGFESV
jgi:uncharacterized protein YrzB (UPF0473 family)